jgi:hypothetical protein
MKVEQSPPKDASSWTTSFGSSIFAMLGRLAIRAAKFLLLSRRFRKSVGEFSTIECFK